jgi:hypothetical protein
MSDKVNRKKFEIFTLDDVRLHRTKAYMNYTGLETTVPPGALIVN